VLVASVHIRKFVLNVLAQDLCLFGEDAADDVPICEIGPEILVMLSWLRGPAALDDILVASPSATQIDVYAKPGGVDANAPSIARSSTGASQEVACNSSSSAAPAEPAERQQQATFQSQSMNALDVFRGPPQLQQSQQASTGSGSPSTSKLKISSMGMSALDSGEGVNRDASQEPDGAALGHGRRGGRGSGPKSQGGRRNIQPGQSTGNRRRPQAAAATDAGQAMPSFGLGYASSGMVPATAEGFSVPQPCFAGFPAYIGKAGGYKGAQRAAACNGSWGGAGYSGKGSGGADAAGMAGMHPQWLATDAGGMAGMDPQWLAAMLPTFWPPGMISPGG